MAQSGLYLIQNLLTHLLSPLFSKIAFVLKTDKEKRRQRRGSEGIPRKQNLSGSCREIIKVGKDL